MFSVTNTVTNLRPLCTANVSPTNSGVIVERRDQVLISLRSPLFCGGLDLLEQVVVDERTLFD